MNEASRVPEWERTKESLRISIPDPFFRMFIAPIHAVDDAETGLVLHVPDHRLIPHIQCRYFPLILDGLKATSFQDRVRLCSQEAEKNARVLAETAASSEGAVEIPKFKQRVRRFFCSAGNAEEIHRMRSGALPPASYIWGPSGCGKTTFALELVAAACAAGRKAAYLTLEDFLHAFARACREGATIAWKEELRGNDLILIDDIQFLKRGALRTQEELRHLIDMFERDGKSLVFLADAAAKSLPFPADLGSRLSTARQVELPAPDIDARTAILRQECEHLDMVVEKALLERIADMIAGDGRRLRSAALRMFHNAHGRIVSSGSDLESEFADLLEKPENADPDLVLTIVADFYKVHPDAIRGPARDRRFTQARHLAAYLLTELLPMRFTDAALALGRKHHTQIIYARRKVQDMMEKDLFFEKEVRVLRRRILDQSRRRS